MSFVISAKCLVEKAGCFKPLKRLAWKVISGMTYDAVERDVKCTPQKSTQLSLCRAESSCYNVCCVLYYVGITLNWGVMIAWSAIHGSLTPAGFVLYLSCVLWTMIYDTIYSHQVICRHQLSN